MPYTIRKVRNKNCFEVKNKITGRVYAKCTTKDKANKQLRLLNAVEHGWRPTGKRSRSRSRSRRTK